MTELKAISANSSASKPPDQAERSRALDPTRSFLVQAPAGSGKTYLLTQRFLRLLAQAEKPDEIVAITFTNAAAAEMRNRILNALERAESEAYVGDDPESLPALAAAALGQSKRLGWQILDQPSQLRITTIDAFCRGLALQSPLSWGLLSGLGGRLDPVDKPGELYRQAARRTLQVLKAEDSPTRRAVEEVLLWRDNNWKDVEELIVAMLAGRNRWYQEFVFARNSDWEALRRQLESPFRRAARRRLEALCHTLDGLPGAVEFALGLARFACETAGKLSPLSLAKRAELPAVLDATVFDSEDALVLEEAVEAYRDLACFLLTGKGEWRKKGGLNVNNGFPATPAGKAAKERFGAFVESLAEVDGLQAALAAFQQPMPVRYTDEEWELMQHCFTLLRNAAVELQMVFAETGSVDFTEVAQIALRILAPENGFPSDFAIRQADSIKHLLIDEFQDTSRSQHQLLANLISAWPEREGRSCFCVGDPMQSIYGFREAEVELFERLKSHGLETSADPFSEPFLFEFVPLRTNFRTVPSLVANLNEQFERIFAEEDGSGVRFSAAEPARQSQSAAKTELHLAFTYHGQADSSELVSYGPEDTREAQLGEIVALIRSKLEEAGKARDKAAATSDVRQEKFRIAVLGRTRSSLMRIAEALQQAGIGFRAIDLVKLRERPEVLDALSLARALLNPVDRTAWLGVLRAPWCGLSLAELHLLTSADDVSILAQPIPALLASRLPELCGQGLLGGLLDGRACAAVSRVERVMRAAVEARSSAANSTLGTWLESIWKALGGADTVNEEQRNNLHLLWAALDKMPEGELDLLGPGLHAALDELYALPDPTASTDFGVQLMTIHKSKGLEFEVVIVPDLEAEGKKSERTMISWLERGMADPQGEENRLTEFLIAPIQAKGSEAGTAKRWVDRVKKERERQELRRVLYVAATRAREELYLFARPKFSVSRASGEISLANPTGLMKTAWPALGERIEEEFAVWQSRVAATRSGEALTLAAQADSDAFTSKLVEMPSPALSPARPTMVRRLPKAYIAPEFMFASVSASAAGSSGVRSNEDGLRRETEDPALYARTEGGLRSRLLGSAIHAFLERLNYLRKGLSPAESAQALVQFLPPVTAEIRSHGMPRAAAEQLASEALAVAQQASTHPVGAWILAPHSDADAEVRWTGLVGAGQVRRRPWNLRPDRIFFASHPPFSAACVPSAAIRDTADVATPEEVQSWWIIDFKTTQAAGTNLSDAAEREHFLLAHREQHAGQLAAYAEVLRGLRASQGEPIKPTWLKVTAGIFYPRLQLLDFWDA